MRRTVVPIELALSGIVPLIVVGWILICAVLAIKAHGRFDLVLWGMIALLPGMFFEYVFYLRSNQDKVSRNSVLLAMAMGGVWYVITVIAELIFTLLLISGAANFIDLETSPWWVSLIMISGFAVLVPGFFEELAKYLITYISSDE